MDELVYCYSTQSKVISLQYMMQSYCEDFSSEVFNWTPQMCVALKDGTQWRISYDAESIKSGQNRCKEIFDDCKMRDKLFARIKNILEEADKLLIMLRESDDILLDDMAECYLAYMKKFIQYYSFSNEFIFLLAENEIKEKLHEYFCDSELNEILYGLDSEVDDECQLNKAIRKVAANANTESEMHFGAKLNAAFRLRKLRYFMRETMVSVNACFSQLIRCRLSSINKNWNNEDIERILENLRIEDLYKLKSVSEDKDINAILCINGNIFFVRKRKYLQYFKTNCLHETEYKGNFVFGKGVISGKVCKDLASIKRSDNIYVAKTLHPRDMVSLKGIKAILLDEGGVLSHAAIIARELRIPCLTNLRFIAEYAEEGDDIEIDFEKGIAKLDKKERRVIGKRGLIELSDKLFDINMYGNKCVNLCRYIKTNNVIPGWVIESSLVSEIAMMVKNGTSNNILCRSDEEKVLEMFPVILRSSSNFEDDLYYTGAGVFESIEDISSLNDFYKGIEKIYNSAQNPIVQSYLSNFIDISQIKIDIAVIVQKYYSFDYLITVCIANNVIKMDIVDKNGQVREELESPIQQVVLLYSENRLVQMIVDEIGDLIFCKEEVLLELGIIKNTVYFLQIRNCMGVLND